VRYWSWIITLPLLALAVVFVIFNREPVALELWPFGIRLEAPLFLIVLVSAFFGLLIGGIAAWISGGSLRRRARHAQNRANELEREVSRLRREREEVEARVEHTQRSGPPAHRV
jgi:uncharacterized integral membrane protein